MAPSVALRGIRSGRLNRPGKTCRGEQRRVARCCPGRLATTKYPAFSTELRAKNGERTGFKTMWKDAAANRFDVLLFWSLDRLTREGVLATLTYLRRLRDQGIAFKSYTEQYVDSLGVFSDAIIGILAAIAQQE